MRSMLVALLSVVCFLASVLGRNPTTGSCNFILDTSAKLHTSCGYNNRSIENWAVIIAYDEESINRTGWAYLEIETNEELDDYTQVYFAGLAEGQLAVRLIYPYINNVWRPFCESRKQVCDRIDSYLISNGAWIKEMVKKYAKTTSYWHHVSLFYRQLEGIYEGFISTPVGDQMKTLTYRDIFMINMLWDMETLADAFSEGNDTVANLGSCSAIVKLLSGHRDLITAHNTWTAYNTMLRVLKKYNLKLHRTSDARSERVPGAAVAFSSYPGVVSSGDDFYVIGSGLVAMETSNGVYDKSLYRNLRREGVMESVRSVVANRLSRSGAEWVNIFRQWNSGTYNNQWMIVDYNKFNPGRVDPKLKGLLWIAEQLPGFFISEDVTPVLIKEGYWASYNVPYNQYIYNISGYRRQFEKFGDWFSHDDCPRAKMFRRDQGNVKDLDSMMSLMRYNDYLHDEYSKCDICTPVQNACNAIAARCDLNPRNGSYPIMNLGHRLHGATDAKVTGSEVGPGRWLGILSVSGPTAGDGLPRFDWSRLPPADSTPHSGMPSLYHFLPSLHRWLLPSV